MHHGVTFNFGSAKECSLAIFETSFSRTKDIWIAATDYYMHFYIPVIVLFPSTGYSPINKFYSFIIFSLLIKAVILLLNCLFYSSSLHTFSFSYFLRHYFLYLNNIWTVIKLTLLFVLFHYF